MEKKTTLRLVILDFDGTVGDTRRVIVRTMQQTIARLGLEPRSEAQCAAMIGLPLQQTFTDLIPMSREMGARCAALYEELFDANNHPGAVPLFAHVAPTIEALRSRGVTFTVASSRGHRSLSQFLEAMQLDRHMALVIGADDVEQAKPAPEPVLKTLAQLGFGADETLVVGDTSFDVEMGRRAGAHTCGVTYGNGSRQQLLAAGAEWVIDDFAQLSEIAG